MGWYRVPPTLSVMAQSPGAGANGLSITAAATERDRRAVHAFIERYIELDATAIPSLSVDHMYDPVVLAARTAGGRMVGALLANRPQIAAAMSMLGRGAATVSTLPEV